jgi:hypothetical protein
MNQEQRIKELEEQNKKLREDLNRVMQYTTSVGGSLEFKKLVEQYASGGTTQSIQTLAVTTSLGLFGQTAASQQSHIANPTGGATIDSESRTAINSILTLLETFGFTATS